MPMNIDGVQELIADIHAMAEKIDADGAGAGTAAHILEDAAKPIHDQMVANAGTEIHARSGDLRRALKIGNVKSSRKRGKYITIGVHRKDWSHEDYYPAYVEYGHGGPAPAPPHPYIRPAYDTQSDKSYEIIRSGLRDAIDKL